ncbi:PATTERN-TRIGGERED IMMUNITY (PTI) COMPROMISED RECEPTOR-LIKE CYTOPLASMIC KINASE 1, PBS1-Like 39 [Hibiscus trionum]|uniref:non-specific serine/threonine protein kinase n=1 Tax=Hibiscus trionum TaxID=183268 RepID=A0A9W7I2K4_HIBTR|nr:PATTERN-TRIGGERED IMMUNITY (PTI) COMPROMISED RECEPTOR-LIKE CYTOPLASMIC KINASE 1, PBS1-Like 39 [Hibiscus trionum]
MKCFHFSGKEKNGKPKTTKSVSVRSSESVSMSMDYEMRRSGSEFNSQNVSDICSTESSTTKNSFAALSQRQSNLREFTFLELKDATKNFSRSLMIGEGGFGCVYRGVIRSTDVSNKKLDIAVKQLSRRGLQGHKEWVTEVNVLGVVEHQNLVKLLGYCAEDDERGIQRLLIYEYMPNRSMQDHLASRFRTTLPWATRMKIAQDAARGLSYLHEGMDFQIIFRDFKSSNILLDEHWNAKLSDFGLARLGPSDGLSHVSTAVVGTIGYAAPEYVQTGRLTTKSDVWSYGVFLYELITGRRPLDRNRPKGEEKLLEWVKPHLSDKKRFVLILDPRLEGKYSLKSTRKLALVANKCLARQAKQRPKMSEVLQMVNEIMETEDMVSPQPATKSSIRKHGSEPLKRRFVDLITGDKGCSVWRTWRPKIMRTT